MNAVLAETEELLDRLRVYDERVEELWYRDPMWDTELTRAEDNASREMESLVARLYRLGRVLEKRWYEPFSNTISISGQGEPVPLDDTGLYDNFTSLESVFALPFVNVRHGRAAAGTAIDQATRFLAALEVWDRRLRTVYRRTPAEPLVVPISLRQDVFPYADGDPVDAVLRRRNVRRFQNLLSEHVNADGGNLILKFPLGYFDAGFSNFKRGTNRLFGNVNGWNYRIHKFKVRIVPTDGERVFSEKYAEIYVAQGGIVSNVNFFSRPRGLARSSEDPRGGEQLLRNDLNKYVAYNTTDLGDTIYAPFAFSSYAGHTDYPEEEDIPLTSEMGSWHWSPFASEWMLQIYLTNTFEIENVEDIRIEMTLKVGPPDAPTAWRLQR